MPHVVAGKINVFPAQRREVGKKVFIAANDRRVVRVERVVSEGLGKDDGAFLKANQKAKLIIHDNKEWEFIFDEDVGQIQLTRRSA